MYWEALSENLFSLLCSGHELLRPHDISGASLPPGKKTVDISRDYAVYYISYEKRGVAQLVERLVRDQEAVRSSRITPTNHSAQIVSTVRASFLHRNARPLVYSILGPRPQAQRAPRPCVQVASLRPIDKPGSRQRSGRLFLRRYPFCAAALQTALPAPRKKPGFFALPPSTNML